MKRVLLTCLFALFLSAQPAGAESMMYIDDGGNIYFAESYYQVPHRYRSQVVPSPTPDLSSPKQRRRNKKLKKKKKKKKKNKNKKKKTKKERLDLKKKAEIVALKHEANQIKNRKKM